MNRRNFVKGVMATAAGSAVALVVRDRVEAEAPRAAVLPLKQGMPIEQNLALSGWAEPMLVQWLEDRRVLTMTNNTFEWKKRVANNPLRPFNDGRYTLKIK